MIPWLHSGSQLRPYLRNQSTLPCFNQQRVSHCQGMSSADQGSLRESVTSPGGKLLGFRVLSMFPSSLSLLDWRGYLGVLEPISLNTPDGRWVRLLLSRNSSWRWPSGLNAAWSITEIWFLLRFRNFRALSPVKESCCRTVILWDRLSDTHWVRELKTSAGSLVMLLKYRYSFCKLPNPMNAPSSMIDIWFLCKYRKLHEVRELKIPLWRWVMLFLFRYRCKRFFKPVNAPSSITEIRLSFRLSMVHWVRNRKLLAGMWVMELFDKSTHSEVAGMFNGTWLYPWLEPSNPEDSTELTQSRSRAERQKGKAQPIQLKGPLGHTVNHRSLTSLNCHCLFFSDSMLGHPPPQKARWTRRQYMHLPTNSSLGLFWRSILVSHSTYKSLWKLPLLKPFPRGKRGR